MATRFYLGADASDISPATNGGLNVWGQDGGIIRAEMRTSAQSPTSAAQTYIEDEELSGSAIYVCLAQFISKPLEAQTLTNVSFKWAGLFLENVAAANLYDHWRIRLVNSAGTAVYNSAAYTSSAELTAGTISDLTVYESRTKTATGLIWTVSAGDRVVLEVGYYASNTKTTSYIGSFSYGYHSGDSDCPENNTTADATAYNAWLECSQTLTFSSGVTNTDRTPTIGAATIAGIAPRNDRGIFVPTEIDA